MQKHFVPGDEPVPGYRLLEEIEGTAFYKLWRVHTPDGCDRCWKIIDLVVGNAAIETRTLGLLVRLRHPYLNTLTNFWNLDDGKTLIIESELPVQSLRDLAQTRQREGLTGITREELLPYYEQAAEGLDFLNKPQHDYNGRQVAIYHRALRPDCLLLFEEGAGLVCKVSDFGLSKPVTDEVAQHSQGLLHYDYDPPEFFEGQTTPTSDQYSLAVNYYELRTGHRPFTGTMLEQLQARLNDRPDLSYLPEPERGILRKALSRDPSRRFENSRDFVRHLHDCRAPDGATIDRQTSVVRAASSSESVETKAVAGVSAPRPTSTGSANRGWRSVTAFEGAAKPGTTQGRQPAAAARLADEPSLPPAKPPASAALSPAGDTSVTLASSIVDTVPARANRAKPKNKPPGTDLRSIREHIGAGTIGLSDPYSGQRRVPVVWVVIILALTALASIWITSNLGI